MRCRERESLQGYGPPGESGYVPLLIYIVGFLVFFRWQIFSSFDLVFGERGDARLVSFIHEHVYRWLYVRSGLLSPPFFFDQANTLGYTDAFLLDQVIYAPLRFVGTEPLLALSLIAVILSLIAFFLFICSCGGWSYRLRWRRCQLSFSRFPTTCS
jgi:hypothetical protein